LPHAAAAGVIFSGQNFCRAQSQICETKETHTRTARETGGDSEGVEMNTLCRFNMNHGTDGKSNMAS
jgi:hypothetical protein